MRATKVSGDSRKEVEASEDSNQEVATKVIDFKIKARWESRWRRNRTGDHFLFYKFIERTTER